MAFTTLSALITSITGMTISGIQSTSKLGYRPRHVDSAMLPLLYCRLPSRKNEISTLTYGQDLRRAVIEVVIWSEFMNLSTQDANDALTVTLIDALADALETNAASLGMDAYEITTEEDTTGDGQTPVQAIIATVEVSG